MGLVNRVVKALTKAESEVSRLEQAVIRWQTEAETKRQELLELEASAGDRLLADTTGSLAREMAVDAQELRFSIDGALAASQAAERQLHDARGELALARAAEKRQEAARLTAVADAHDAKVGELLRQLRELDGVDYTWHEPSENERHAMWARGTRIEWTIPNGDVLRDPIAPLLAEAEALEAPVLAERRAREAAARPLVPSAQIDVPAWDDVDGNSTVLCSVSEGCGSAVFEIGNGEHFEPLVTLPAEDGRRSWGKTFRIAPGAGLRQIRCNGKVLAEAERPGRLMTNGLGTWYVKP